MTPRQLVVGLAILSLLGPLLSALAIAQQPYILGPEDVIEVSVFENENVSRVVTIRPDGMISLPLIGDVQADGLTPEQLRERLGTLLSFYIKNPKVAVIVREFRRVRVSVLGQVTRPGIYELRQGATVLDAVAAAGGLTETATLGEAKLVRGQAPPMVIDLERLLLQGEFSLNQRLQSGDSLIVPDDLASRVYVLGEVAKPGVLPLRSALTALQALSLTGGATRRALLNRAYIIRRTAGSSQGGSETIALPAIVVVRQSSPTVQIIPVDLPKVIREGDVARDVLLQRGDVLYVPENPLSLENILLIFGGLKDLRDVFR